MRKLRKKLRASTGETLVETLCALLVLVMSSALLAVMLSAAQQMNLSAMEQDKALYTDLTTAEAQSGGAENGTVSVLENGVKEAELPVLVYGGEEGLTSYRLAP